jgi:hypothetical protein
MDKSGLLAPHAQPVVAQPVVAQPVAAQMGQPQTAQPMMMPAQDKMMMPQMAMPAQGQPYGVQAMQQPAAAVFSSMQGAVAASSTAGHGLDVLGNVQGLCLRQKIRVAELLVGWEQKNRFKIMVKPPTLNPNEPLPDEISEQLPPIFWAVEDSDCCERQFCHNHRSFTMNILNAFNEQILSIERPFTCTCMCQGLCLCQPNEMTIKLPTGAPMGRIVQGNVVCNCDHWFSIEDGSGGLLYTIRVPFCECWATPRPNCCFSVWTAEVLPGAGTGETAVATLQNIWPGCNVRGMCTKADNFQVRRATDSS